jgi:NAD(P)-dependent dehydrogenase (short-subunit alcohol dehydrogenase family)
LPLLVRGRNTRVVNLSSGVHHRGAIHFDDLQLERGYGPWKAYGQSKLAMLMFALELQRQSDANNWCLMSNAAHPGFARTDLIANLPTLFAATSPTAQGGAYYGPDGMAEMRGAPTVARIASPLPGCGSSPSS